MPAALRKFNLTGRTEGSLPETRFSLALGYSAITIEVGLKYPITEDISPVVHENEVTVEGYRGVLLLDCRRCRAWGGWIINDW